MILMLELRMVIGPFTPHLLARGVLVIPSAAPSKAAALGIVGWAKGSGAVDVALLLDGLM
jgi:hypothetical protein